MSSEELEVIDVEAVVEPVRQAGLFGTDDPAVVIERATKVANALKDVLRQQRLIKNISGREHILAEGWTMLGAMVGVFPRVEWSKPMLTSAGDQIGWEAAVEVVNAQGMVIGRAEAECLRSESSWRSRDDYAVRSMAQTRAMSKALRMPLGFIAVIAGYDATPAEEMPSGQADLPPAEERGIGSTIVEPTKKAILDELRPLLKALGETAPDSWSIAKVCEAANANWGKQYTKLDQLTKEELQAVLAAAKSAA